MPTAAVPPRLLSLYRGLAYVTGIGLVLLVCVGMPLKYLADEPFVVEKVGVAHGFLYMAYVAVALWLAYLARWGLGRVLVVLLAGTIPFAVFFVERGVTRELSGAAQSPAG